MSSERPSEERPVATGIAGGSLGTGTAVDEETTLMAVPEVPEPAERPEAVGPAPAALPAAPPAAAPVSPATTPPAAEPVTPARRSTSRRDPYRPIGIALAAILVALAGLAALSSGGDSPIDAGAAPAASQTPAPGATGDEDGAGGDQEDDGGAGGQRGNCNGRGNDPCDREGGDGD